MSRTNDDREAAGSDHPACMCKEKVLVTVLRMQAGQPSNTVCLPGQYDAINALAGLLYEQAFPRWQRILQTRLTLLTVSVESAQSFYLPFTFLYTLDRLFKITDRQTALH